MTKNKLDLLRTEENKRISPYGEYYISVENVEMLKCYKKDEMFAFRYPTGCPLMIKAVFETCPMYFDREKVERWAYAIPLAGNFYTTGLNLHSFDISILFPSLTTLNILDKRGFVKLLIGNEEIYEALYHLFNNMPALPGSPPVSAFDSYLKRNVIDIETRLKLQIGYPITFEDIEEARYMEVRERALRKFGYENYVREGFKKKRIGVIHYDDGSSFVFHPDNPENRIWYKTLEHEKYLADRNDDEKIICFRSDIAFLQVKDSSTNKAYFLKVPPNIHSVEEAKAWTFGLNPGEYNPVVET